MERTEWNDIIKKCADDYSKIKNSSLTSGIEIPPRDFIRAWMQTNYDIIKLSGYFYRKFNSIINSYPKKSGELSESFVHQTEEETEEETVKHSDDAAMDDIVLPSDKFFELMKKYLVDSGINDSDIGMYEHKESNGTKRTLEVRGIYYRYPKRPMGHQRFTKYEGRWLIKLLKPGIWDDFTFRLDFTVQEPWGCESESQYHRFSFSLKTPPYLDTVLKNSNFQFFTTSYNTKDACEFKTTIGNLRRISTIIFFISKLIETDYETSRFKEELVQETLNKSNNKNAPSVLIGIVNTMLQKLVSRDMNESFVHQTKEKTEESMITMDANSLIRLALKSETLDEFEEYIQRLDAIFGGHIEVCSGDFTISDIEFFGDYEEHYYDPYCYDGWALVVKSEENEFPNDPFVLFERYPTVDSVDEKESERVRRYRYGEDWDDEPLNPEDCWLAWGKVEDFKGL